MAPDRVPSQVCDNTSVSSGRGCDLWLDCLTQQEIADAIRVPRKTISDWLADSDWQSDFAKVPESRQHFDVWNFQQLSE